jgi:hypothetical protein
MAKIKVKVNTKDLTDFTKNLHDDINYEKVLSSYIDGVTSLISRKHGKPFTYQTPTIGMPAGKSGFSSGSSGRRYLRSRTNRLIDAIRSAKFSRKVNTGEYNAGYDVATILSMAPHARIHLNTSEDGNITFTTLRPRKSKYFYIPLKNAVNARGIQTVSPPKLYKTTFQSYDSTGKGEGKKNFMFRSPTGEVYGGKQIHDEWEKISVKDAVAKGYDFSGEDMKKLRPNTQLLGRNNKPYFKLAKKIKVPNRLTLQKELSDTISAPSGYYSLKNRLQTEVNRMLRKASKR